MLSVGLLTVWLYLPAAAQWSEPVRVSRNWLWAYSLAMDSAEGLHAVWSRYPPDDWLEYASKKPTADTWMTPEHITPTAIPGAQGVVVIGPNGTPHVIWISYLAAGIFLTRREGGTWTTPEQFPGWNRAGSGLRGVCDRWGRIHIVWQGLNTFDTIWYARYEAGNWVGPETVAAATSRRVYAPDVMTDHEGNAIVAYVRTRDSLGPALVRQTGDSWTAPTFPRGTERDEWTTRVALDSNDNAIMAWHGNGCSFFSEQLPDSWSLTERLDSGGAGASAGPVPCVDRWNRLHVLYTDRPPGAEFSLHERTRIDGQWREHLIVDSFPGWAEVAVSSGRLHVLLSRDAGSPYEAEAMYTWRPLSPPGVEEESEGALVESPEYISPVTPSSTVFFALAKPERVHVDIIDSAGRCIDRVSLGLLRAGRHDFRPFGHVPARGVAFLRIVTAGTSTIVKVVRIN